MPSSEIAVLVNRAFERAHALKRFPESTYRLQFHKDFTFRDATAIVPYLAELGVTHLYASPYLRARPGSTHGYDVIDHGRLNPELGTQADFDALMAALKQHGMSHILDTVPNHVGVATNDNFWWNDVLENGPASKYAYCFDIAWDSSPRPEMQNRLLLPLLGKPSGEALEAGELRLVFDDSPHRSQSAGSEAEPELSPHAAGYFPFSIHYFDRRFPVSPRSYRFILTAGLSELDSALGADHPDAREYRAILEAAHALPDRTEADAARLARRHEEKESLKRRLTTLTRSSPAARAAIEHSVQTLNGTPGEPRSFDRLDQLLMRQCYRLAYWRVAPDEINYRRFFDINDLAGLSVEHLDVFEASHALPFSLLAQGHLAGLRIDHPDGLYDPLQYLQRLQIHYVLACAKHLHDSDAEFKQLDWGASKEAISAAIAARLATTPSAHPLYVTVEKILAPHEPLPGDWACHGTSGYDFLNVANALFVDPAGRDPLTEIYQQFTGQSIAFSDLAYQKKKLILQIALSSELHMLAHRLDRIAQRDRSSRDFTMRELREALAEVIACFGVYRTYITDRGVHDSDRAHLDAAITQAMSRNPAREPRVFEFIRQMLLQNLPVSFDDADRAAALRFAGKFQQLTAPVTAKGIEDTAFYLYNRLLSLNEVGNEPDRIGMTPEEVHAYLQDRQRHWPYALSALSTHDTKRSEEVRARINVLSEIPEQWSKAVTRWSQLNAAQKTSVDGSPAPDANDEYLIYQTLIGIYPASSSAGPDADSESAALVTRIGAYLTKALREAKLHSMWTNPNAAYEKATLDFAARLLDPTLSERFLADFKPFHASIARWGILNSLSQTLLRLAAPGVPDTYQGTELWDFSLVDPDNRRPVDYAKRRALLSALSQPDDSQDGPSDLLQNIEEGRAKLLLTATVLRARREHPGLFSLGDYIPGRVEGPRAQHVFAFARHYEGRYAIAILPRLIASLVPHADARPTRDLWEGTTIAFASLTPGLRWRNILTGARVKGLEKGGIVRLALPEALNGFPVALLLSEG